MKDQITKDLIRKGQMGLSNAVKNFRSLGLLTSGNDERGG
jgi:hypothetical protein